MKNVLILGGTVEASALAKALASRHIRATFSYAGRVSHPKRQPLPTRVGGFGGVAGLVAYIQREGITHLVDATHPFAAQMSRHVLSAAALSGAATIALTRPAWAAREGDRWQRVASVEAAVAAFDGTPQRVLLAIGRMHLEAFAAQPQHHYVLRLVDEPQGPLPLPNATTLIDRGPFSLAGERALLSEQRIAWVVCKNAGGDGAAAKLTAAREQRLPVTMIERPHLPERREAHSVAEVLGWLEAT